jgi:hypothetical protein
MIIAIIILAYVANVFLNRYINKLLYLNRHISRVPLIWLFPFPIMLIVWISIVTYESKVIDWFTGESW